MWPADVSEAPPEALSDVAWAFDQAHFRQVMGYFPTGVTVVTAAGPQGTTGLAIGSFGSVSLEPPLVMFMPAKQSLSWPQIEVAGHFGVNILAAHQAEVSQRFASHATDKFVGLRWSPKVSGAPIFEDSLAWVDCKIERVIEAGDHWIVLGLVLDLGVQGGVSGSCSAISSEGLTEGSSVGPLIFLGGEYGSFQPLVQQPPAQ
ncbi:MAG: flavin reductase family protein [Acidimicrobiia bacterium]|nr:flavin reductase family protein [Acidimicrobiia bacterium]MYC57897.1 flavin reductase family protein [Acidimicrobiia bacterium]MYG93396.1 flavin reductase family protein [Acidimicrobiia bacterium]MYI29795.1 flavin reductase family protein [Acidimicrobiia bacterium]